METELITPKAHKLLTTVKWQILMREIYLCELYTSQVPVT